MELEAAFVGRVRRSLLFATRILESIILYSIPLLACEIVFCMSLFFVRSRLTAQPSTRPLA